MVLTVSLHLNTNSCWNSSATRHTRYACKLGEKAGDDIRQDAIVLWNVGTSEHKKYIYLFPAALTVTMYYVHKRLC